MIRYQIFFSAKLSIHRFIQMYQPYICVCVCVSIDLIQRYTDKNRQILTNSKKLMCRFYKMINYWTMPTQWIDSLNIFNCWGVPTYWWIIWFWDLWDGFINVKVYSFIQTCQLFQSTKILKNLVLITRPPVGMKASIETPWNPQRCPVETRWNRTEMAQPSY